MSEIFTHCYFWPANGTIRQWINVSGVLDGGRIEYASWPFTIGKITIKAKI